MNYKNAIKQEFQALLLTEDIDVDIKEEGDQLTFAILVGNGSKGGLHLSSTVSKFDAIESIQVVMTIFRAQLIAYAIGCLKKGYKAKKSPVFVPEFTDTLLFKSIAEAQSHYQQVASVVASFDVFHGTYFGGAKITKKPAPKKSTRKASDSGKVPKKIAR